MDELEIHMQVGCTREISRDQDCEIIEAWAVIPKEG